MVHPLHARLLAMDGAQAYLARLLELEYEYRRCRGADRAASIREAYQAVRANFCRAYPERVPPPAPLYLLHT